MFLMKDNAVTDRAPRRCVRPEVNENSEKRVLELSCEIRELEETWEAGNCDARFA